MQLIQEQISWSQLWQVVQRNSEQYEIIKYTDLKRKFRSPEELDSQGEAGSGVGQVRTESERES